MSDAPATRKRSGTDAPGTDRAVSERAGGWNLLSWLLPRGDETAEPPEPIDDDTARSHRQLAENVARLLDVTAAEVMVPRVDIIAVEAGTPFSDLVKLMVEMEHSRLPVYKDTLDRIVGMVHVKDVLPFVAAGRSAPMAKLLRQVLFVAPSMPALDLLSQMRAARTHMALVVDEFGGIDGLITIEDLVEEIVGDIEDEHDEIVAPNLVARPDGTVVAEARTPIELFEERFGVDLLPKEDEEEVDTLGGLVFTLAGRVPSKGEVLAHPSGLEFEVLDADPHRVKRLRVRNLPGASERVSPDPNQTMGQQEAHLEPDRAEPAVSAAVPPGPAGPVP